MSARCDNCDKSRDVGHNVSHAKNRTFRIFRPNLQKLRVLRNGLRIRVRFCSSCIQRLKKYGHIGVFYKLALAPAVATSVVIPTTSSKKHIDREEKKIEEIMKKEEKKWKDKEMEEKETAKKKAVEKVKIEELVGKK